MVAPVVSRRFPDVTRILVAALEVWVDGDSNRTGPATPADLQARLPFVRAVRIGGGRDRLSDFPTVSVDVFAASYSGAETLMEDIDQWLCGPPPPIPLFDRVEHDVAPRRLPWGDETLFRWQAQYTVVTRRVPRI
jgi:hypothetical protein